MDLGVGDVVRSRKDAVILQLVAARGRADVGRVEIAVDDPLASRGVERAEPCLTKLDRYSAGAAIGSARSGNLRAAVESSLGDAFRYGTHRSIEDAAAAVCRP